MKVSSFISHPRSRQREEFFRECGGGDIDITQAPVPSEVLFARFPATHGCAGPRFYFLSQLCSLII
ncbi:MAG: hypothetical protein JWR69_4395 [Pedosphaera sp.]|nr:hypothetical protein [Pedosphaera sp.]